MISAVNSTQPVNTHNKTKTRYLNIKYSGYAAMGFGAVCGITGLKKVKFKNKMTVHKISAILAGISALWHLGTIKQWDKLIKKEN